MFGGDFAGRLVDPEKRFLLGAGVSDDVARAADAGGGIAVPERDQNVGVVDGAMAAGEIGVVAAIGGRFDLRAQCARQNGFDAGPFVGLEVVAKAVEREREEEQPRGVAAGEFFGEKRVGAAGDGGDANEAGAGVGGDIVERATNGARRGRGIGEPAVSGKANEDGRGGHSRIERMRAGEVGDGKAGGGEANGGGGRPRRIWAIDSRRG